MVKLLNECEICTVVTPAAQGLSMEDLGDLADREGVVCTPSRDYEVISLSVENVLEEVGDSDSGIGRNSCLASQVFEVEGAITPCG